MRGRRPASRSGRSTARSSASRTCSTSRASRRARARRCWKMRPPAKADAPVVRRLRAAGAVIVAKTNMSEFAFSGVGMNPHYGTPGNPADRARVPGGSSSGAAVAAADGMCEIAIGTDTGGSTRIPAALCGIVGFKPSQWRVPTEGAFPLSYTLELDRSDRAHGRGLRQGRRRDGGRGVRAARARAGRRAAARRAAGHAADGVGQHGRHALRRGAQAARRRRRAPHRRADAAARRDAGGQRQGRLRAGGGVRDPSRAAGASARTTSIRTCACASSAAARSRRPTTSICRGRARGWSARWTRGCPRSTRWCCRRRRSSRRRSPRCRTPSTFNTKNMLLLRNTATWNFFDMCAISMPMPGSGLPVGLMLVARNGHDRRLFEIAARNRASFRRVRRGSPGAKYVIGHNNTCLARPKASKFAQTFQGGIHELRVSPAAPCLPAPPPRLRSPRPRSFARRAAR